MNISDNDEARSVLHTIDGGYIILVSEVIDWPSYSTYPIRGSSFLVKTDSLGLQEWVTELDNSLVEDLQLDHDNRFFFLMQDIDGSYIVRTSFSSPEFNCFIIDANGGNQTISYKGYENILTSNDESYSYDLDGYFDSDLGKFIFYHSISKIGSMGDTLWTRDSIDSKLLAIDSNFMIGPGVSNTLPRILTITDDNGFLFVNFGPCYPLPNLILMVKSRM